MNAVKRYLLEKHGFIPDGKQSHMPFPVGNYVVLESTIVDSEKATVTQVLNVAVERFQLLRNGELVDIGTDDGNPSF